MSPVENLTPVPTPRPTEALSSKEITQEETARKVGAKTIEATKSRPKNNPNIPYIDTLRPNDPEYMAWVKKRNKELETEYFREHNNEPIPTPRPTQTPEPTPTPQPTPTPEPTPTPHE